jgi:predicted HTH transcriptional regulator
LKNEYLIKDLMKICKLLNYKSKIVQNRIAPNYWRLNILREGMKRFYEDYLILNKEYVVIDLGKKGEKIKNSFKIYARKLYKVKGNEELVLEILNKEQLSVNQLAERLAMTRQGIRYHIKNLINQRKIKIIDKNELNWIYGI